MDRVDQLLNLILGKAYAQDVDVLSRIGAHAVPEGDAAAQLFDDEAGQRVLILPGEDQGLDADVLLVYPVQHHGGEEVVDD